MTKDRFPLLATLDDDALDAFQRQASCRQVNAGEPLLEEGSENDHLYLVASGRMVVRKRHRGRELPIGFVKGGDICGERSLLHAEQTAAAVYGASESEVYEVPGSLVARQYRENAHFRRAMDLVIERRQVNAALALNPLFSVLPMEVRQSMYHVGEMVRFARGEEIIHQYDRDIQRMYLLLSGEAESSITVPDASRKRLTVARHAMGDQVGEIALLTTPMRIATVTITTAATALCISNKTLHTFRMGSLDFAMALYDNTRRAMVRQMDLLTPEIGADRARAITLDRMVPLERYRNPEQQMAQPFI